jgi:hypothetical protein
LCHDEVILVVVAGGVWVIAGGVEVSDGVAVSRGLGVCGGNGVTPGVGVTHGAELAGGVAISGDAVMASGLAVPTECGFNDFVARDMRIGLENGRQGQLGGWHWRLALGLVLIEDQQFLLEYIDKQLVAVLPQKHKQLGAADTFEDGVFSCRQLDWWMLQRWTHEKPSFRNGKKTRVSHATIP